MKKLNIAMIDDDRSYNEIMSLSLSSEFNVRTFENSSEALQDFMKMNPDLVLLDLHLSTESGFDACRKIKSYKADLPVFFLTSDRELVNITRGLECGGVDYISKSMDLGEIICRLKGRMGSLYPSGKSRVLTCRNIQLDPVCYGVTIDGQDVELSIKEFEILHFFMENQDIVISKTQIHEAIWKGTAVHPNNIDTQMFKIRKKLMGLTTGIECRKGRGYILRS